MSRFLARNAPRLLEAADTLWVNPPPDLNWIEFHRPGHTDWFTQDEAARRALATAGAPIRFGAFPMGDSPPARAVLCLPREKARLRMLAHALADGLSPDGVLFLAGETRAGARSAARQVEPWFGSVDKLDSARHCVLFRATAPRVDAPFDPDAYRQTWRLDDAFGGLPICSYPGVFAHGDLDAGTQLLLESLQQLSGAPPVTALDLGCGAGVIGTFLLSRHPGLALTCADSSALALAATRSTLAANGFRATVQPTDGLAGVDGRFDLVVSNPPFHDGHRERDDLGAGLFDDLRNFLNPGGQCIIVANRHLPWPRWMDQALGGHQVLTRNDAFHVLAGRSPAARRGQVNQRRTTL